jgi:hypothetical protein
MLLLLLCLDRNLLRTFLYNKLYLKSENIKHYNTSSNELLNPTLEYAYINNKTKTCTQYLQEKKQKTRAELWIIMQWPEVRGQKDKQGSTKHYTEN